MLDNLNSIVGFCFSTLSQIFNLYLGGGIFPVSWLSGCCGRFRVSLINYDRKEVRLWLLCFLLWARSSLLL